MSTRQIEFTEAELLDLLQRLPLEQALGRLEAAAAPAERERLPEQTQGWLARSVRVGVWVLLFLGLFTAIAWRLNASYWKDV